MPIPLGTIGLAAATGAAGAAGALAVHEAHRVAQAQGPKVAAVVRDRFNADRERARALAGGPAAIAEYSAAHPMRNPFRRRVTTEALGYLERVAEKCPSGPARYQCPCQRQAGFHTQAVEFLHTMRHGDTTEPLAWKRGPAESRVNEALGGKLRVGEKAIWEMMARKLYASGDLTALAVREGIQNSVDAVLKVANPDPRIDVTYDEGAQVLTLGDNGIGMNYREVHTGKTLPDGRPEIELDIESGLGKLLTLGASGKDEDVEAGGGFGLAKAVILGAATLGRWSVHTLDKRVISMPLLATEQPARVAAMSPYEQSLDFVIDDAPHRQGTLITLYDIPAGAAYSPMLRSDARTTTRIVNVLRLCDLPDIRVTYNGALVVPYFPAKGGRAVENPYAWGDGVTARVRRFDRSDGQRGAFWVRAASKGRNFLLQWATDGTRNSMFWDVVVDLKIKARPKDADYPITGSRDRFVDSAPAYRAFRRLVEAQSRQAEAADTIDWDVIEPSDDEEAAEMAAWAEDPAIQEAISGTREILDQFYGDRSPGVPQPAADQSEAPGGTEEDRDAPVQRYGGQGVQGPVDDDDDGDLDDRPAGRPTGTVSTVPASEAAGLVAQIRGLLGAAAGGDVAAVSSVALGALDVLEESGQVSMRDAEHLIEDLSEAADSLGMVEGFQARKLADAVVERATGGWAGEHKRLQETVKKKLNPFGKALLKVSMSNYDHPKTDDAGVKLRDRDGKIKYDRSRSKKFLRRYRRYLRILLAWDTAVQIVHRATEFAIPVRTGFILDDSARGLSAYERGRTWVLLNPEQAEEFIRLHKAHPQAIALYFWQIACHELAHTHRITAYGDNHDVTWAKEREDLGFATAHLLGVVEEAIYSVLKLRDPNKRRGQVKRMREERDAARAEITSVRSELDRVLTSQSSLIATLTHLRTAMLAYEFAGFVESPLGQEALADVEVPGLGRGATAMMRLLQQDPDVALNIIRRRSAVTEALGIPIVAAAGF